MTTAVINGLTSSKRKILINHMPNHTHWAIKAQTKCSTMIYELKPVGSPDEVFTGFMMLYGFYDNSVENVTGINHIPNHTY